MLDETVCENSGNYADYDETLVIEGLSSSLKASSVKVSRLVTECEYVAGSGNRVSYMRDQLLRMEAKYFP